MMEDRVLPRFKPSGLVRKSPIVAPIGWVNIIPPQKSILEGIWVVNAKNTIKTKQIAKVKEAPSNPRGVL